MLAYPWTRQSCQRLTFSLVIVIHAGAVFVPFWPHFLVVVVLSVGPPSLAVNRVKAAPDQTISCWSWAPLMNWGEGSGWGHQVTKKLSHTYTETQKHTNTQIQKHTNAHQWIGGRGRGRGRRVTKKLSHTFIFLSPQHSIEWTPPSSKTSCIEPISELNHMDILIERTCAKGQTGIQKAKYNTNSSQGRVFIGAKMSIIWTPAWNRVSTVFRIWT